MAEISIGNELKDAFKPTDKWVKAGVDWLGDLESFYRQRAQIENEYAEKLQLLCSESFKKKAKVSALLSVGPDPTITPGSLEGASLVAWTEVLSQTEQIAKERRKLAGEFDKRVAGGLADMQVKYDGLRHRWKQFNDELVSVRDKHFDDVTKSKKEYDSSCQSMENQRAKSEKSSGERAQHKYEKREYEMNVAKNAYLIKINVANRLKDKYYYQDLPEVLDGFQSLNEARVSKLNSFWLSASALEKQANEAMIGYVSSMDDVVKQNLPKLDTAMFVKHNLKDWKEPQDFYYIPSSIWHDDETMITEDRELEVLKQQLNTSSATYEKYEQICADEKQQLGELMEERRQLIGDTFNEVKVKSRDEYFKFESLLGKGLTSLQKFANDDTVRVVAEVELETIQTAASGKDLTLTRPVEKKKKGALGFLRISSKSSGSHEYANGDNDDMMSLTSGVSKLTTHTHNSASTKSRLFGQIADAFLVPADQYAATRAAGGSAALSAAKSARALYAYTPADEDEVSINVGDVLQVVEEDTGSGWTRVTAPHGESGLVPSSYIQMVASSAAPSAGSSQTKKQGPKVAPKRGAKRVKYMDILYDYEPQGDDELGVAVGDRVLVVTEDDGSGWTEGEIEGIRGLFPTSYGRLDE